MRTLRGGNSNTEHNKSADMKNNKKKEREPIIDDDVGANGDETTDDEGGVDTPPPPREEDEDSKGDDKNDADDEKEKEKEKDPKKNKEDASVKGDGKADKAPAAEEGEYEVEQVVDMEIQKRRKCPVSFRVRWLGFSEKEDSWLPANQLTCDDLVQEFLEISGRKSEYERAFQSRKRAAETPPENCRQSSRKTTRIAYSELDEDQDEILPSGTRTRKVKTKAEKKEMPTLKGGKGAKKKGGAAEEEAGGDPALPVKEQEFEVEKIVDHRVKGRFTDYKIRWKGFGAKHDEWIAESQLNCPSLIKAYNKKVHSDPQKDETFEVESIAGMRETKGRVEYKVRWKNWGPKYDSWLPEDELHCPEILNNFKTTLEKLEKQEDWQVETIQDSRERRGKTEYLIRWKGFDHKCDTWEPEENLQGCKDIFEKYVQTKEKEKDQTKEKEKDQTKEKEKDQTKEKEKDQTKEKEKDQTKEKEKDQTKEKEKEKKKVLNSGRKTREDRPRPERYVENFTGGSRSRSKRKSAGTSYSEFYNQ